MTIATFGMWVEDFVDEDNGEVVSIERNEVIAVDGKPSNGYRVINYYSVDLSNLSKGVYFINGTKLIKE